MINVYAIEQIYENQYLVHIYINNMGSPMSTWIYHKLEVVEIHVQYKHNSSYDETLNKVKAIKGKKKNFSFGHK